MPSPSVSADGSPHRTTDCVTPPPRSAAPATPAPLTPEPSLINAAPSQQETAEAEPLNSIARSRCSSTGSPIHLKLSPQAIRASGVSVNANASQDDRTDKFFLSGPIDDTCVLAEHTRKLRDLLWEPVSSEGWSDFMPILDDAGFGSRQ